MADGGFEPIETAPIMKMVYVRTKTQTQKQLARKDEQGNWRSKSGRTLWRRPTLWKPVE